MPGQHAVGSFVLRFLELQHSTIRWTIRRIDDTRRACAHRYFVLSNAFTAAAAPARNVQSSFTLSLLSRSVSLSPPSRTASFARWLPFSCHREALPLSSPSRAVPLWSGHVHIAHVHLLIALFTCPPQQGLHPPNGHRPLLEAGHMRIITNRVITETAVALQRQQTTTSG